MTTRRQALDDAQYLSQLARDIESETVDGEGRWPCDGQGKLTHLTEFGIYARLNAISARLTLLALDLPDAEAPR